METRAAGLIIYRRICKDLEYLLLQASYREHHWTPPKGHLEPGETDLDAALRETVEETGFTREELKIVEDFKKVLHYTVDGRPKTVVYWLAELFSDKPVVLSKEHEDFKWAKLEQACKLAHYADLQGVLKDCEEFLTKNHPGNK